MQITVVDEHAGNPFPSRISLCDQVLMGFSHVSAEGFYHNDERVKHATIGLANIIGLKAGQRAMDVGYGTNLSVAQALRQLGLESNALDSQDGLDRQKYAAPFLVPPHYTGISAGVRKYCGTIEDILNPESELRNEHFDLFTFWGSWESGGNNFAIGGEMGEFRLRYEYPDVDFSYEKLVGMMQANRERVIRDTASLLTPQGGILVVSSRYAYHGGGFTTEQLPWEKRIMLRLGNMFSDSGARESVFVGVSQEEVKRQLRGSPAAQHVLEALGDEDVLFSNEAEVYEATYPETVRNSIREMNAPLGRIDAVYGRF
jgi:hypothetical protein